MRLTLSESNNSGAKTKTGVASEKGGNAKNTLKLGMASEDAACAHLFMHACVWVRVLLCVHVNVYGCVCVCVLKVNENLQKNQTNRLDLKAQESCKQDQLI